MDLKNFSSILVILFLLSSCSQTDDSKEIGWSDLIPFTSIFNPSDVKFNKSLNGKVVKIPGYLIPLHYEAREIKEFMLVPYIGACIHVPPPPCLLYTSPSPRD